jgi:3-methyladenine DNA glycosylase AlkD
MKSNIENLAASVAAGFSRGNVDAMRAQRKEIQAQIKELTGGEVIELATLLIRKHKIENFVAYELIHFHKDAAKKLNAKILDDLVKDLDSWWTVDTFAPFLSGVAWREGRVSDKFIHKWARDKNFWIRRAAVVSTIALNTKARGGKGEKRDSARTLAVCDLLIDDREDMIVKAVSWALRELAKRDPDAVRSYITENDSRLASRIRREVNNKLTVGIKNVWRRKG